MGMIINPYRFGSPKVLAFEASYTLANDFTVYTFAASDIGTEAADRRVIVYGWGNNGTRTLTSLTIGGVTADIVVQSSGTGNGTSFLAIALVPTGATADIVVTWSGAQVRSAIGVWSCTGLTSNAAEDFDSSGATPAVVTLTTVTGGFVVCGAGIGGTGPTVTWSGTGVTERFESIVEVATAAVSGADASTTTSSLEVTATHTGAGTFRSMVAASW